MDFPVVCNTWVMPSEILFDRIITAVVTTLAVSDCAAPTLHHFVCHCDLVDQGDKELHEELET